MRDMETANNPGTKHSVQSGLAEGTHMAQAAGNTTGVTADAPFSVESSPGTGPAGYYRGVKGRESTRKVGQHTLVGDGGTKDGQTPV